jgi:2-amino-4-hydroxy-6-hydroxymethyldihydropteridine diphosphokinase
MHTAYIALGSNVGERDTTLRVALQKLHTQSGVSVRRISQFHRTEPLGGPAGQDDYFNAAAEVETELSPENLLAAMQAVESELGRDRSKEVRWGPRTCDLDLLLFGEAVQDAPSLTIPHPRMHERRFVLEPLAEIAPDLVHPVLHKTITELLAELAK